jgi:acetyl-CoA synthetase
VLLAEDLGSLAADGYLSFHSRKDDVIISSGYRIGPDEIEESLTTHEAVADAGVIGVPDEMRGEIPKAFVVLGADHEPAAELEAALQAHVKERLAKYEYPRELEFIAELPKTTTGKIRRHDLREREELISAGGADDRYDVGLRRVPEGRLPRGGIDTPPSVLCDTAAVRADRSAACHRPR